jgi:hypothetical protein
MFGCYFSAHFLLIRRGIKVEHRSASVTELQNAWILPRRPLKPFMTPSEQRLSFAHGTLRQCSRIVSSPSILSDRDRWYNTTYVLFAASILLLLLKTNTTTVLRQRSSLLKSVDLAVEILEAMDESFVAKRLAELISRNLKEVKDATVETSSFATHTNPNWYNFQIPSSVCHS